MDKIFETGGQKPLLFLGPMAGVTDCVFRRLAHEHGCEYSCTEMVSAKGLYYHSPGTEELLTINPELEGKVAIQIFGSEPKIMAWAAKQLESRPNYALDINMGCPVPKVFKNGEGSALLKNPQLAGDIIKAVKDATSKPVTAKMRVGIGSESYDYVGFAKALEEAGADAVAVHGRTREQYYSGRADRQKIKEIKEALSIPVIANGDVTSLSGAEDMMDETGCELVMIGRAAMGNPWVFEGREPDKEELKETIHKHLMLLVEFKGSNRGIKEMRKHVAWYIKGGKGAAALRNKINQATTIAEIESLLKEI